MRFMMDELRRPKAMPRVLLTGASGALGGALLRRTTGDVQAIIVRRSMLTRVEFAELPRIDAVVHISSPLRATAAGDGDVEGRLLDFVEAAQVPLYWISGEFANAESSLSAGARTEPDGAAAQRDFEKGLRQRLPNSVVIRTSVLIGDSRTGSISPFPAVYRFFGSLLAGDLRWGSKEADGLLDLMPCDIVADVVAKLVQNGVTDRVFWLTMGESALTASEVVDIVRLSARESGPPAVSPVVTPTRVRNGFPDGSRQSSFVNWRMVGEMSPVDWGDLLHGEPLETSLGDAFANSIGELGGLGIDPLPDARESLQRSVRHWGRSLVFSGELNTVA